MQMRRKCRSFVLLIAIYAVPSMLSRDAWSLRSSSPPESLARQVDHIELESEQAEQIFQVFAEKLGLPVAWPFKSYGRFSSGGVVLGNVALELVHEQGDKPGLKGFAFRPGPVPELVAGLDAKKLKHDAPKPFYQKDSSGNDSLAWTTVDLTGLQPKGIFFCKYTKELSPAYLAEINQKFLKQGGGLLGVRSALELVLEVRDLAAAQRDWRLLLGSPDAGHDSVWHVGTGPAIRLVAGTEDRIAILRLKVMSLERARTFLKGANLLGLDSGREISLEPSAVGADIRLVE